MAGKAHPKNAIYIKSWLSKSRQLNPADWRSALLWFLLNIHPRLLDFILRLRHIGRIDPRTIPPFADINLPK
jgi:hypothetical protein